MNRAGAKVGRDLGQVAGLDTDLGVVVEDCDIADYSAMEADIGVVTMTDYLEVNFPTYERLMGAGVNVAKRAPDSVSSHGSRAFSQPRIPPRAVTPAGGLGTV